VKPVIRRFDFVERRPFTKPVRDWLQQCQIRQLISCALKKEHRDAHVRQMRRA
jgi:hypothetical protein